MAISNGHTLYLHGSPTCLSLFQLAPQTANCLITVNSLPCYSRKYVYFNMTGFWKLSDPHPYIFLLHVIKYNYLQRTIPLFILNYSRPKLPLQFHIRI